ncbi:hypothetical protein K435DRAFT_864843 [Dendrothele bispora CBS 962.96]|uniref:Uncharacterized protein n=1 Tax=Dendrothele bispora (strain CBS 962.96) TaxID=1314807 RepID=A0A4S8LKX2_DENBC|nr:hypothetical protein K435DRAFT_864843 [Dendrothele bispora CBS 962.96]
MVHNLALEGDTDLKPILPDSPDQELSGDTQTLGIQEEELSYRNPTSICSDRSSPRLDTDTTDYIDTLTPDNTINSGTTPTADGASTAVNNSLSNTNNSA